MADLSRLCFLSHNLSIFVFLLLFIHGHSFLIGGSPQDFYKGDILEVKANKLTSAKTNRPNSYYSIPYCRPHKIFDNAVNLGEILRGDHVQNSPYEFRMRVATMCNIVCRVKLDEETTNQFKEKIDDEYRAHMILEDLPLVTLVRKGNDASPPVFQRGYSVGGKVRYANTTDEKYYINNHLSFIVSFHRNSETASARIVWFAVKPYSINHKYNGEWSLTTCDPHAKRSVTGSEPPQQLDDDQKEIIFTYDVDFWETDIKWASRWNTYLLTSDDQIHWFSLLNSLMIVLSISGMVAMLVLRRLHRNILGHNQLETVEEAPQETGWKLVHGDVFRPPVGSESLCVLVGTGVQIFGTVLVTISSVVSGLLSSSNYQTEPMTAIVPIWAVMGVFGGLATARLYKTFELPKWNMKTTLTTACMFPASVFSILVALNYKTWGSDTMLGLLCLWLGVSVPLVFIGSYIGSIESETEKWVKNSNIQREIPKQSWYMSPFFTIMIGGIVPFGAVFNELLFMLASIGLHRFYYMLGLVFVILIITCAEVTILLCYFQLCREDYRWWWRSYLTAGSSAFYFFIYATFYFFTKLNITEVVPSIFYFGYMLIASYALFVLTGTIGFYACMWFIRHIYSSLEIV